MKIKKYALDSISTTNISHLTGDSFFGSVGFARLWETVGGEPIFWVVENDEQILGVMPSVQFGKKPLARLQAMPDGCYGRIFYDCEKHQETDIQEMLFSKLINESYQKIFFYDFKNSLGAPTKFKIEETNVQIVDIGDINWMPPDSKLVSQIRKAEESKLVVRDFDSNKDLEEFLKLVDMTAKRHSQKVKYPKDFYAALAELATKDERIIWLVAETGSQMMASHIRFIEDDVCLNWQAYSDKEFSDLHANQYLIYSLTKILRERGISRMNLGASPFGAEGLEKYKERWGGTNYSYNCLSYKTILGKLF